MIDLRSVPRLAQKLEIKQKRKKKKEKRVELRESRRKMEKNIIYALSDLHEEVSKIFA